MSTIDHKAEYEAGRIDTTDGKPPKHFGTPAPSPEIGPNGQHASYWVLSESERAKGFVRPVRRSYRHQTCGAVTTMGQALAETYAARPTFYGATMCVRCGAHFPVGPDGEFTWVDERGQDTGEKVGS